MLAAILGRAYIDANGTINAKKAMDAAMALLDEADRRWPERLD